MQRYNIILKTDKWQVENYVKSRKIFPLKSDIFKFNLYFCHINSYKENDNGKI